MAKLIFLGTAAALPSVTQDNASFLVENNGHLLMVDCSGNSYRKLIKLKLEPNKLDHVLITHAHVDHSYGLSSLIECLWIAGRQEPLHIYGLRSTLAVLEPILDLYSLRNRPIKDYPIRLHQIEGKPNELVLQDANFTLHTLPSVHAIPSVASKLSFDDGTTLVYSSDTAPFAGLVDFAKGSDNFILECTYCDDKDELAVITGHVHSSEWGQLAAQVDARRTFLTHHSLTEECGNQRLLDEISQGSTFPVSRVIIPQDFDEFDL